MGAAVLRPYEDLIRSVRLGSEGKGGRLIAVMLLLSVLLAVLPLAGIAWIVVVGSITSVDGLFMSLILLTLSGVFLLNCVLELRERGWLGKKAPSAKPGVAAKTAE